ncbi:MAG TPA: TonB-dependent receptor [Bacteroidota bacterium]|nr:TonB-dependent receptor [Bacteroidota bacterium]
MTSTTTHRVVFLLACMLTVGAVRTAAQQTGRIVGKAVESRTGEGLPGANVVVKGTYYGGTSDIEGNVWIERINPGAYTVEVSLLGYKLVRFTNVKVEAGETTTLRAKMEETVLTLDQDVVVIGERPLFDIEETSSRRNVQQADIQAAAVQNVQSVVAMQPGVVMADNEIHIRGGRTHENAFLLDGISVQDPMAGSGFGLQLSPSSIQEVEVITGGYNAEYGQATSGIVNITTREGSDAYSGALGYKTDKLGFNKDSRSNWNTDIFDAMLSGPEPLTTYVLPALGLQVPGSVSFFGSVYANLTDGYTRWVETVGGGNRPAEWVVKAPEGLYSSIAGGRKWAPRRSNNYSWLTKLTWKPDPTMKLSYAYNQSVVIDQNTQAIQSTLEYVEPNPGYQYLFQYIPDSAQTFTQVNIQHSLSWMHTLSKQTFYEIKLSRYTAHIRGDANGKAFSDYLEPQDIVTYPIVYYNLGRDTVGVIPGDGFYDIGSPTSWRDHFITEYTLKGDLTSFFTEKNKFKTGFEMRFQDLQMVDIYRPWVKPLGFDYDIYGGNLAYSGQSTKPVRPLQGSFYAQDNIALSGMLLNFGLRLDYWAPGKYVDDIAGDTSSALIISKALREAYLDHTFSLFGRRVKARLSPRLGISHPVSDNQTLFFSYGHFSKFPRPQYVYAKLNQKNVRSSLPVGNPDLNPETTVAYELGLRNQLSGSDVLTITAFYKDIFDYITEKTVLRLNTVGGAQYYSTYLNSDYGRVRGIEVEYKTRFGNWFRGGIAGSYSIATGKSSTPNENIVRIQQGEPENIRENYLIWDRPLQISMTMNFTVPKGQPLFDTGEGFLDDWNAFVRVFYQSGKRYTPQIFTGYDPVTGRPQYVADLDNVNSGIGSPWFYIDLNLEKTIQIGFGKIVVGLEVQNVLNNSNSQIINSVTGKAYEYGDATPLGYNDPLYPQLSGSVSPFPYNPARYLNPRTIRGSLSFRF